MSRGSLGIKIGMLTATLVAVLVPAHATAHQPGEAPQPTLSPDRMIDSPTLGEVDLDADHALPEPQRRATPSLRASEPLPPDGEPIALPISYVVGIELLASGGVAAYGQGGVSLVDVVGQEGAFTPFHSVSDALEVGGRLFVIASDELGVSRVVEIDETGGAVLGTFNLGGRSVRSPMVAAGDALWVPTDVGDVVTLARVDLTSGIVQLDAITTLASPTGAPQGMVAISLYGEGSALIVAARGPTVESLALVARFDVSSSPAQTHVRSDLLGAIGPPALSRGAGTVVAGDGQEIRTDDLVSTGRRTPSDALAFSPSRELYLAYNGPDAEGNQAEHVLSIRRVADRSELWPLRLIYFDAWFGASDDIIWTLQGGELRRIHVVPRAETYRVSHPIIDPTVPSRLVIEGRGFAPEPRVTIGGAALRIEEASSTRIVATVEPEVPAGGMRDLVVTSDLGEAEPLPVESVSTATDAGLLYIRAPTSGPEVLEGYTYCSDNPTIEGGQRRLRRGDVQILRAAPGTGCELNLTSPPGQRITTRTSARDNQEGADIGGAKVPVEFTRRSTFVTVRLNQSTKPVLWIEVAGAGDVPQGATARVLVTCGRQTRRLAVPVGGARRIRQPDRACRINLTDDASALEAVAYRFTQPQARYYPNLTVVRGLTVRIPRQQPEWTPVHAGFALFYPNAGHLRGRQQVAIGAPGHDTVRVYGFDDRGLDRRRPAVLRGQRGSRFGAAVATADFDGDGDHDVAVGAPGTRGDTGAVAIFQGSRDGVGTTSTPLAVARLRGGDRLGYALTVADIDVDGYPDVVAGAPGRDIDRSRDAGAIVVFFGGPHGLTSGRIYQEGDGTFVGTPEAGNRFGFSVSGALRALAVGVPGDETDDRQDAGSVQYLFAGFATSELLTQPPREHEAGDELGTSVVVQWPGTRTYGNVYAGAPGEDLGQAIDAGAVYQLGYPATVRFVESSAVGDEARSGERLGASVTLLPTQLLAGAPGEVVDGLVAGGLAVFPIDDEDDDAQPFVLTEGIGPGVPGQPASGDDFGAMLAVDRTGSVLIVGVPGQDVSRARNAGAVMVFDTRTRLILGPRRADARYGSAGG